MLPLYKRILTWYIDNTYVRPSYSHENGKILKRVQDAFEYETTGTA